MSPPSPKPYAYLGTPPEFLITVAAESPAVFRIEGQRRAKFVVRACHRQDQLGREVRAVAHVLGIHVSRDDLRWLAEITEDFVTTVLAPRRAA